MNIKKVLGIVGGENMIGKTYGHLLVLKEVENYIPLKTGKPYARPRRTMLCRCVCGKEHVVIAQLLKCGNTTSCGCKKGEGNILRNTVHGKSKTTEYNIWNSMHRRCKDKKHRNYELYGGRGIKVCKRWRKFENFLEDMGHRPNNKHTLDRWPNKNGDYKLSNCRWATSFQQNNNKRTNVIFKYQGVKLTMKELSLKLGVKYTALNSRRAKGWSLKEILQVPIRKRANNLKNK